MRNGEVVLVRLRRCCTPAAYWKSSRPTDRADTTKTMRLKKRAVFLVSRRADDEVPSMNSAADETKTNVNQIIDMECEKCNFAKMKVDTVRSEVCTAPC